MGLLPWDVFDRLVDQFKIETLTVADFLVQREADRKLLVFYSLGFLSDNYAEMTEDALKAKKDYEATYFSARASEIRQFCEDVFKDFPQKDYYRELEYKIPRWGKIMTPIEQLQEIANFVATNLPLDSDILSNSKELQKEVGDKLKKLPTPTEVDAHYIQTLKQRYRELRDKPSKLGAAYELILLIENVHEVVKMLSEEQKKKSKRPARAHRGELAGFKV
jgi:hypothetical protein